MYKARCFKFGIKSGALCDICREKEGVDWHHIYSRGMTEGNDEARILASDPALGSQLCQICHRDEADTDRGREFLIDLNISIWGYDIVKRAHDKVDDALITGVPWEFPGRQRKDAVNEKDSKEH